MKDEEERVRGGRGGGGVRKAFEKVLGHFFRKRVPTLAKPRHVVPNLLSPMSIPACPRHSVTFRPSNVSSAMRMLVHGTVSLVRLQYTYEVRYRRVTSATIGGCLVGAGAGGVCFDGPVLVCVVLVLSCPTSSLSAAFETGRSAVPASLARRTVQACIGDGCLKVTGVPTFSWHKNKSRGPKKKGQKC